MSPWAELPQGDAMVGVKADSDSHPVIERTGTFAVNVLGEDQLDVGKAFFRTTVVEGDTLNAFRFERGPETGARRDTGRHHEQCRDGERDEGPAVPHGRYIGRNPPPARAEIPDISGGGAHPPQSGAASAGR